MGREYTSYIKLLRALLPSGKAWAKESTSVLTQILTALAQEFSRTDDRSNDLLLTERDSRYTNELLDEWEEELDLPSSCLYYYNCLQPQNDSERRTSINRKHTMVGGTHKGYFIDYVSPYGYVLQILEYGAHEYLSHYLSWMAKHLFDERANPIPFMVGAGTCGESIHRIPFLDPLPCILNQIKPAHTKLFIGSNSPSMSNAFSLDFDIVRERDPEFGFGFSLAFDAVRNVSDCTLHDTSEFSSAFDMSFARIYTGAFNPHEFSSAFDPMRNINQIPYTGDFDRREFSFAFNIN